MSDPMNPNPRPSRNADDNGKSDPRDGNLGPRPTHSWILLPAIIVGLVVAYWAYQKYADAPVAPSGVIGTMLEGPLLQLFQ